MCIRDRPYIEIGREFGCEVEAVWFDVPLEVCLRRNAGRSRVVPEAAMVEMAGRLAAPTVSEGFVRVTIVE